MATPSDKFERQRSYRQSLRYEFGQDVLVHQRKKLGLSQQDVAARAGLSRFRIIRIENGAQIKDSIEFELLVYAYQLNSQQTKKWVEIQFGTSILRFILKGLHGG
jgi:DNA-binding XRE family transcriptional regulator